MMREPITVQQTINAPIKKVWDYWTQPEHITHWNNASPDWFTPRVESNLQPGGRFSYRMEARDGSFGFDFEGVFDRIVPQQSLEYTIGDGRKVRLDFSVAGNGTKVVETFEPESQNSVELQRQGWQAILDNFKKYTEAQL